MPESLDVQESLGRMILVCYHLPLVQVYDKQVTELSSFNTREHWTIPAYAPCMSSNQYHMTNFASRQEGSNNKYHP